MGDDGACSGVDAAERVEAVTAPESRAEVLLARRREIQRKLDKGAALTDPELLAALRWYRQLRALTDPLGPEFGLFRRAVVLELEQMLRWKEARREKD